MTAGIKANVDGSAAIQVGGSDAISITAGLDVGIGTSSPGTKLNVQTAGADVEIRASTTTSGDVRVGFDAAGAFYNWIQTQRSSGAMQFAVANTERMRIDSSGNVGIGTSSPSYRLDVVGTVAGGSVIAGIRNLSNTANSDARLYIEAYSNSRFSYAQFAVNGVGSWNTGYDVASGSYRISNDGGGSLNTNTRMVIDSSGNLLINTTTRSNLEKVNITHDGASQEGLIIVNTNTSAGTQTAIGFRRPSATTVGNINTTLSATAYVTSSDYRLKENVQPMTGALEKVAALKPCTYTWKIDGSDGQGFIAHELAEVVPDAVSGEKDAVNEDGSINPQGIDTSFLVATLTAALQEQQAMIDEMKAEIAALKGAA
jgi:hypothetical protein